MQNLTVMEARNVKTFAIKKGGVHGGTFLARCGMALHFVFAVYGHRSAGLKQYVPGFISTDSVSLDLETSRSNTINTNGNPRVRSASSPLPLKQKQERSSWSSYLLRSKSDELVLGINMETPQAAQHLEVNASIAFSREDADPADPNALLLLDLDKCTIFGSDGNDLGIAMQWMHYGQADLTDLYRLLINPCVAQTYQALKAHHANLQVAIYTERPALLQYRPGGPASPPEAIPWNPDWLHDGQLYIQQSASGADDVVLESAAAIAALPADERDSLQHAVGRLLAARTALRDALGLDADPDIVVTATPKDVPLTARKLGCPAPRAYLWDDNPGLHGRPGAIVVPPFTRLAPAQRDRLLAFLEERLPIASLPSELVEFMFAARGADRSLVRSPCGALEYRLPAAGGPGEIGEPEPWPLPQRYAAAAASSG